MFSYVPLETRIPEDHPLPPTRTMTDEALRGLSRKFNVLYSHNGLPSIPPEQLLRALVVQVIAQARGARNDTTGAAERGAATARRDTRATGSASANARRSRARSAG